MKRIMIPQANVDVRWLRERVMQDWSAEDANIVTLDGVPMLAVYLEDNDPHTEADLSALCATFVPGWKPQAQIDAERIAAADDLVGTHLAALKNLAPADRVYAAMGRLMAVKDGADQATIDSIVDRATAGAYVTSKPEWTSLPAQARPWVIDELDMLASLLQIVIVRLS